MSSTETVLVQTEKEVEDMALRVGPVAVTSELVSKMVLPMDMGKCGE